MDSGLRRNDDAVFHGLFMLLLPEMISTNQVFYAVSLLAINDH